MKALVVGASGFVGRALTRVLTDNGVDTTGTYCSRAGDGLLPLDLRDAGAVHDTVNALRPEIIFCLADVPYPNERAFPSEQARAVLVEGRRVLASLAKEYGASLVLYSSDEVFDRAGPYCEEDPTCPGTRRGALQAEAEEVVRAVLSDPLIIRTGMVYGWDRTSDNFAQQVQRRLETGGDLTLPADVLVRPTLVDYLVEVTLRLVQTGVTGTVHVAGRDHISLYEFARLLARSMALDTTSLRAAPGAEAKDQPTVKGGLAVEKLAGLLGTEPMSLQESMKRFRRQWRADTHVAVTRPTVSGEAEQVRQQIFGLVERYYQLAHRPEPFVPFQSRVNYAGRFFDAQEMLNLADSMLDFWLTLGPYGDLFESKAKKLLGCRDFALVNSGSSANLTAVASLVSPLFEEHLKAGDEVITPAVTFPTTLAPLIQHGLVPVFVDCELGNYNIDVSLIEAAISPKTRALFIPHTLGNPFDLAAVTDIAKRHGLLLVEDTCDALGATFQGRPVGTFGVLGTLSFYPAHQMTMGEGGGVIVNAARLSKVVKSVRDWGRDCWCAPGESNTCGKRFGWCLGDLPQGYDHKYTYSGLGYNLKPTDLQAAIGVAQLDKLPGFVERRRHNFERLYEGLAPYQEHLLLPTWHPEARPSWFGFPITAGRGVSRHELVQWLEAANIETREVFGGNILRQPGYRSIRHRVAGTLENSDRVMRDTFFVGVYPGITDEMADFMVARFSEFFRRR